MLSTRHRELCSHCLVITLQVVVLGDSDDEDDAEDVHARRATQAGQGESSDIHEDESFRRITFLDDRLVASFGPHQHQPTQ